MRCVSEKVRKWDIWRGGERDREKKNEKERARENERQTCRESGRKKDILKSLKVI